MTVVITASCNIAYAVVICIYVSTRNVSTALVALKVSVAVNVLGAGELSSALVTGGVIVCVLVVCTFNCSTALVALKVFV